MAEDAEELRARSSEVDRHDAGSMDDDDYVCLVLYKLDDGRYWREVESSGMNSEHAGAMGAFDGWIGEGDLATWTET